MDDIMPPYSHRKSDSFVGQGRPRVAHLKQEMSSLLSSNMFASGTFATGRSLDPQHLSSCKESQPCLPRIKLKAMTSSLALPLSDRQAERLKEAQTSAGQERDVNADGTPETRLPWAVRPETDFKIVNHKAWSTTVVAPVVRQVQEALGCGEWQVEAVLSELLFCEEGCFYSEGPESEDSPEEFALLMFQLPSTAGGGVFTVSDPSMPSLECPLSTSANAVEDRVKERHGMSFSGPGMYYVAFYTDCERELSQVTDGNLLTLVYNLRRVKKPATTTTATATATTLVRSPRSLTSAAAPKGAHAIFDTDSAARGGYGGRGGCRPPNSYKGAPVYTMPGAMLRDWATENALFFGSGVNCADECGVSVVPAAFSAGASDLFAGFETWPCPKNVSEGVRTASASTREHALRLIAQEDVARRRAAVFVEHSTVPQPAGAEYIQKIAAVIRSWSEERAEIAAAGVPSKLVLALSHPYPPNRRLSGIADLKGRDRAICNLLRLAREILARDPAPGHVHVPISAPPLAPVPVPVPAPVKSGGGAEKAVASVDGGDGGEGRPGATALASLMATPTVAAQASVSCDERGGSSRELPGTCRPGRSGDGLAAGDQVGLEVFLARLVVSHGGEGRGAFITGPLVPLEPGDEQAQVEVSLSAHETLAFHDSRHMPDEVLPVDVSTEILHSGGPAAFSDLECEYDKMFMKGPQAVEFLGRKVNGSGMVEGETSGAPQAVLGASEGGCGDRRKATRFYSRAAIILWPRSKRGTVQRESQAGTQRLLARLRRQLSTSVEAPPKESASELKAMAAAVLSLVRQPHSWIENEDDKDVVFECLHMCEDPATACRAISALCSVLRQPDFAPGRLPSHESASSSTASTDCSYNGGNDSGGAIVGSGDAPFVDDIPLPLPSSAPAAGTPFSSVSSLFSRVFSLLDGLDCWRLMLPQLMELIRLNPTAFAGAVIARSAISGSQSSSGRVTGHREGMLATAAAESSPSTGLVAGEAPDVGERHGKNGLPSAPVSPSSAWPLLSSKRARGEPQGTNVSAEVPRGAPRPRLNAGVVHVQGETGRRIEGSADRTGVATSSWRAVVGETLAGAVPDVARGRMRGVPACCTVANLSSPFSSTDAFYSPLPLMIRALQDVVGDLHAARMVRDAFSWVVRGERELAEPIDATVAERELRIDQLGSLLWSLGDLRRSLPPHRSSAAGAKATGAGTVAGGNGEDVDDGDGDGDGDGDSDEVGTSYMRVVVEQLEVHLVRVLDETASMPLPKSPFVSFKMESRFTCEHGGRQATSSGSEDEEAEDEGDVTSDALECVTCREVVKPFMDNPFACWMLWVPWTGPDQDEQSEEFYKQLGLQCSVEGGAVQSLVLTKPNGSFDIHEAMQPLRDALYLRDRAVNLLKSANALAWLHFGAEGSADGGDRANDGDGLRSFDGGGSRKVGRSVENGVGCGVGDGHGGVANGKGGMSEDNGVGHGGRGEGDNAPASAMKGRGDYASAGDAPRGPVGNIGGGTTTPIDFDAAAAAVAATEISGIDWPKPGHGDGRHQHERGAMGLKGREGQAEDLVGASGMSLAAQEHVRHVREKSSAKESHAAKGGEATSTVVDSASIQATTAVVSAAAAADDDCSRDVGSGGVVPGNSSVCGSRAAAKFTLANGADPEGTGCTPPLPPSLNTNSWETKDSQGCESVGEGDPSIKHVGSRRKFDEVDGVHAEKNVGDMGNEAAVGGVRKKLALSSLSLGDQPVQPQAIAEECVSKADSFVVLRPGDSAAAVTGPISVDGRFSKGDRDVGNAPQHDHPPLSQSPPQTPSLLPATLLQGTDEALRDNGEVTSGPLPPTAPGVGRPSIATGGSQLIKSSQTVAAAKTCAGQSPIQRHDSLLGGDLLQGLSPTPSLANELSSAETGMSAGAGLGSTLSPTQNTHADAAVAAVAAAVAASGEGEMQLGTEEAASGCVQS